MASFKGFPLVVEAYRAILALLKRSGRAQGRLSALTHDRQSIMTVGESPILVLG